MLFPNSVRCCRYVGYLLRRFFTPVMRIWFLLFLIAKLDLDPTWSWWVVSIPIWVSLAWFIFLKIADTCLTCCNGQETEENAAKQQANCISLVLSIISLVLLIPFLVLVIVKLDGGAYAVAVAFIPLFIAMSLTICCCCCCLPILCGAAGGAGAGMPPDDEEVPPTNEESPMGPDVENTKKYEDPQKPAESDNDKKGEETKPQQEIPIEVVTTSPSNNIADID